MVSQRGMLFWGTTRDERGFPRRMVRSVNPGKGLGLVLSKWRILMSYKKETSGRTATRAPRHQQIVATFGDPGQTRPTPRTIERREQKEPESGKPGAFRSSKRRPNCPNWFPSSSLTRPIMTLVSFHRTPAGVLVEAVSLNKNLI